MLAYRAADDDIGIRFTAATPEIRAALGGKLPVEMKPEEVPVEVAEPLARHQALETDLGGALSFWHQVDDLLNEGQEIRLGLTEMENPQRPDRRAPFGFALKRNPSGAWEVSSVHNPKGLPGAPKVGTLLDSVLQQKNPNLVRKMILLAERWGDELSSYVARRTR